MTADELRHLRHCVSGFLDELQEQSEFVDRLDEMKPTPEFAAPLSFESLKRVFEAKTGESIGLAWVTLPAKPSAEEFEIFGKLLPHARDLQREGFPVEVDETDGDRRFRVPVAVVAPTDQAAKDEIDRYCSDVEAFAQRWLLDAAWGPAALHDALRYQRRITLPQAPREGFVAPPVSSTLVLDPDMPWRRDDLRRLGELLVDAATEESEAEPGIDPAIVLRRALDAVRAQLRGEALSSTQRSHRARARSILDGAVSGRISADRGSAT
ncbi:MAG: hypothetical protein U0R51_08165 [Solirubrobacterales bacterium]